METGLWESCAAFTLGPTLCVYANEMVNLIQRASLALLFKKTKMYFI